MWQIISVAQSRLCSTSAGSIMMTQKLGLLVWLKATTLTVFLVLSYFTGFYQSSLAVRSTFGNLRDNTAAVSSRQNPGTVVSQNYPTDDAVRPGLGSRSSPGLPASQLPASNKISPGVIPIQQIQRPMTVWGSAASNSPSFMSNRNSLRDMTHPPPYQQQSVTSLQKAPQATLCGGQLWLHDWQPQSISSPNYPGNYPDDIVCEWRIYANYGAQIRINATDFALENSETCKSDYVQFFWGNGSPSTWKSTGEADRFCGTEGPFDLVFKDNNLVMNFVADKSRSNKGTILRKKSDFGFNISFSIFQICAVLYKQPDFYGTPSTLEVFYESDIWPTYGTSPDTAYQSVEIAEGCKLMINRSNFHQLAAFRILCLLLKPTRQYFASSKCHRLCSPV